MKQGYTELKRFLKDESGATAIEYGLILALLTLAMIAGLTALGGGNTGKWESVKDEVVAAT